MANTLFSTLNPGAWKELRPRFLPALLTTFVLLQLLFLANLSYLSGTQYRDSTRSHNLNLLYVDFDGVVIGQSVSDAYNLLKADSFPTGQQGSPQKYPNMGTRANRLNLHLELLSATRSSYYANNASSALASANLTNLAALQTFLDPIQASEVNIKAMPQGGRVLYNAVSMVIPIVQQFFFIMAMNGISSHFDIFTALSWTMNVLIRSFASFVYTFISALCMCGYIWGFRESLDVNGTQFVLTWMIVWLYMHINFGIFDILTTFIPMQYLPFCVLTWVLINVSSTISPFELQPGFYKWSYALPAHELYQVMVQIWSRGCNNQLYRALPIMFMWWVVCILIVVYAVYYRCRTALAALRMDENDASSGGELGPKLTPDATGHSFSGQSTDGMIWNRRNTAESLPPRKLAYGPGYPTVGFTDDNR
ncbi:hypothetical protein N7467_002324 [Penicillium canescens]|nr:hypothetical protein N7467_002324 [Penicillium canescens]